jgi:hypothetical protein
MRKLRGRAATPVRPGLTIKKVLWGRLPLANGQYVGQYVTEASISDIHRVYRRLIYEENQLRKREHRLRGMNIHSFTTLFKFARYLGLVEFVRNDNRLFDYGGNLVEGNRKIFRLSDKGRADYTSWFDLRRAWQEWRLTQVGVPTLKLRTSALKKGI